LSAGQVFGILRVAVTGQKVSPPLFESMAIIGRETVLDRIRAAIDLLAAAVNKTARVAGLAGHFCCLNK
jgi:glutamyl-tRNA synthetase